MSLTTSISLLLALLTLGDVLADDQSPIVTLPQGTLRGQKVTPENLAPYYSFLGIPYAEPPVGELRFKAPVPAGPWNGTRDALQEGNMCVQQVWSSKQIDGEEDCLYINVYTPELPSSGALRPVMVWIHGGGFTSGSGNKLRQGPEYFLNTGIVYVSLNYRLGFMGFMSTEDAVAPGNAGMKDQVLALRWVQQNIAAFGGDPSKVTIWGESAGGAAVSYLMLSPMSEGLFRAAIADSGSAASNWAVAGNPRENAFLVGKAFGFTGENSQDLVNFLRNVTAEDLIITSADIVNPEQSYRIGGAHNVPCVEPVLDGEEAFMSELPETVLQGSKFHKVPFLTGINLNEGVLHYGLMIGQGRTLEEIDRDFIQVFKPELRICNDDPCGDEMEVKTKAFYFGNESISPSTLQNFVDLCTDVYMGEGTVHFLDMMSALSSVPVYFYHFIYDGALRQPGMPVPNITGPYHADELGYLFNVGLDVPDDSEAAQVRSRMVTMWSNFVKTGNPTTDVSEEFPAWLPYSHANTNCLEIGAKLQARTDCIKDRMDFWFNLYGYK